MDDKEMFLELIKTFNNTMEKTDNLNKRLIRIMAIIVFIVGLFFCITFSFFINSYFKTDYGYPDNKTTIQNTSNNNNNNNTK